MKIEGTDTQAQAGSTQSAVPQKEGTWVNLFCIVDS